MRSSSLAPVRRGLARLAGAVAASAVLSACSFITGVPSVSRVELSVTPATIAPGQQVQASAAPIGNGGGVVTHPRRQLSWRSDNDSVASVTAMGLITGISSGRTRITASAGGESKSVEITVRPTPVTKLLINDRTTVLRLSPVVTRLFTTTAVDTAGRVLADRPATWTSLDTTVAAVTSVGIVTPRAVGTARITASVDTGLAPAVGKVADTVSLRVTLTPVTAVRIEPRTPTVYVGQTLQFRATIVDSLNNVVTDRRVVWRTDDRGSNLAVDSLTGLATAVAATANGTIIRASVETVQGFPGTDFRFDAQSVQVLAPAASTRVRSGATNVTSIALRAGTSQQLTFVALDAVNNELAGRQFSATSDTPAVATANAGGLVTAGSTAGSATITVQPLDAAGAPQGRATTFTVTVTP
jgi:uncharacterized protein YjdB